MKKQIYYILFFSIIITSCNDWLKVDPQGEFEKDKMFQTQDGFEGVLIGLYTKLNSNSLYNGNLTFEYIEYIAQQWSKRKKSYDLSNDVALIFYKYNYNAFVKGQTKEIYIGLHNVIANANTIISSIDKANKKNIFEKDIYELIKGEALAVRAFCYFDILRLFGPIPTKGEDTEMNMSYDKELTHLFRPGVDYEQFCKFILDDLNAAEKLLEEVDPMKTGESVEETSFKLNRKFRMNYYAVLGLKARFYLWTQDKNNAYKYAKKIIDSNKFRLGNSRSINEYKYTFPSEHIIALPILDIEKNFKGLFCDAQNKDEVGTLFVDERNINRLYLSADIRKNLWEFVKENKRTNVYALRKYKSQNAIPLMRLSEMYLILAECAPNLVKANDWFFKFVKTRGFNTVLDEANKSKEIIKEYKREFYAEGQLFYTYKRLNVNLKDIIDIRITSYSNPYIGVSNKYAYVIPLPDREVMAGYKNPVTK
jgi:hypothetical protein